MLWEWMWKDLTKDCVTLFNNINGALKNKKIISNDFFQDERNIVSRTDKLDYCQCYKKTCSNNISELMLISNFYITAFKGVIAREATAACPMICEVIYLFLFLIANQSSITGHHTNHLHHNPTMIHSFFNNACVCLCLITFFNCIVILTSSNLIVIAP